MISNLLKVICCLSFFGLKIAAIPYHSYSVENNDCEPNQYYDPVIKTCRRFAGGGRPIFVDHRTQCADKFIGVKPYPNMDKFYYLCQNDSVVIGECNGIMRFNDITNKCEPRSGLPCNLNIMPKCTSTGRFAIAGNCSCFYTCDEIGQQLTLNIYQCPGRTFYSPISNGCSLLRKFTPTQVVNSDNFIEENNNFPLCTKPGLFRSPNDCSKYYACSSKTDGIYYQTRYKCPIGFLFDIKIEMCMPKSQVECEMMSVIELLNLYEYYKEEKQKKNCNYSKTDKQFEEIVRECDGKNSTACSNTSSINIGTSTNPVVFSTSNLNASSSLPDFTSNELEISTIKIESIDVINHSDKILGISQNSFKNSSSTVQPATINNDVTKSISNDGTTKRATNQNFSDKNESSVKKNSVSLLEESKINQFYEQNVTESEASISSAFTFSENELTTNEQMLTTSSTSSPISNEINSTSSNATNRPIEQNVTESYTNTSESPSPSKNVVETENYNQTTTTERISITNSVKKFDKSETIPTSSEATVSRYIEQNITESYPSTSQAATSSENKIVTTERMLTTSSTRLTIMNQTKNEYTSSTHVTTTQGILVTDTITETTPFETRISLLEEGQPLEGEKTSKNKSMSSLDVTSTREASATNNTENQSLLTKYLSLNDEKIQTTTIINAENVTIPEFKSTTMGSVAEKIGNDPISITVSSNFIYENNRTSDDNVTMTTTIKTNSYEISESYLSSSTTQIQVKNILDDRTGNTTTTELINSSNNSENETESITVSTVSLSNENSTEHSTFNNNTTVNSIETTTFLEKNFTITATTTTTTVEIDNITVSNRIENPLNARLTEEIVSKSFIKETIQEIPEIDWIPSESTAFMENTSEIINNNKTINSDQSNITSTAQNFFYENSTFKDNGISTSTELSTTFSIEINDPQNINKSFDKTKYEIPNTEKLDQIKTIFNSELNQSTFYSIQSTPDGVTKSIQINDNYIPSTQATIFIEMTSEQPGNKNQTHEIYSKTEENVTIQTTALTKYNQTQLLAKNSYVEGLMNFSEDDKPPIFTVNIKKPIKLIVDYNPPDCEVVACE